MLKTNSLINTSVDDLRSSVRCTRLNGWTRDDLKTLVAAGLLLKLRNDMPSKLKVIEAELRWIRKNQPELWASEMGKQS